MIKKNVLKVVSRFMIGAALKQQVVTYGEIQRNLGLSRQLIGPYLGAIGFVCLTDGFPLLNALAVNTATFKPTCEGFDPYHTQRGTWLGWGDLTSKCWKWAHKGGTDLLSSLDKPIEARWDAILEHLTHVYEGSEEAWKELHN